MALFLQTWAHLHSSSDKLFIVIIITIMHSLLCIRTCAHLQSSSDIFDFIVHSFVLMDLHQEASKIGGLDALETPTQSYGGGR